MCLRQQSHCGGPKAPDTVKTQGTGPETIPRFYFPRSERMASDALAVMHAKMDTLFSIYPDGLTIPAMKELIKEARPCHCT